MNLKIKSKKISEFTYELSIVAAWKDIKADFELCKKKLAKDIKVPGFRKGKIPDNILMTQYLGQIEMNFVQDFSEKYYILALQKEELNPINQAALKDIDFAYEKDFSFKSEFEIEPPLSAPKLKKNMVTVEKTNFISNDKEVEDTVTNILNSQSKTDKIEEGSAEGDFMIADFQEVDESGIAIIGKKEKKYIAIGQEPLGAGVMGAQIAGHIANAGIPSLLFDINEELAQKGVDGLSKLKPAPLFSSSNKALVTPCTYDNDLEKLSDCDLIIEAVAEKIEIKHAVYKN